MNFKLVVNFRFLDGDVPHSPSYSVYISQLFRFARICSNASDFNHRNQYLAAKLLKPGYQCQKIRKTLSKFYHRHSELIVKYYIGLKTFLQKGISELAFYGDSVYRAYPGSEFVVANTLAKWKKLEPNEINFSQGFSQKVSI